MKLLTLLFARKPRPEIVKLEAQLQHLGQLVDRFYELLGERNWVFHDDLSTQKVEGILVLTVLLVRVKRTDVEA